MTALPSEDQKMDDPSKRPKNREVENEMICPPDKKGEPPRPKTEPKKPD